MVQIPIGLQSIVLDTIYGHTYSIGCYSEGLVILHFKQLLREGGIYKSWMN